MTDPTDQTQAADPLAELEALLAKAKAAKTADGSDAPDAPPAPEAASELQQPPAPDPAEVERQQQQAALENEQMVTAQRAKMAEIGDTPQYQARLQDQGEKAVKKEDERAASDGFEIHQVTTTKIDQ